MLFLRGFLPLVLSALFFTSQVFAATVTLPDFTELAENHSPSVVKIGTVIKAKSREQRDRIPEQQVPEMFKHFFEGGPEQPEQRQRESSGSGFFISSDGYILTNNHVVDGADEVKVWLTDRSEYTATVVGVDPRTDLAVLKIEGSSFTAVNFGDSERLKVGEWVLAIGSPFNLDYSVTAGIVSAIGRNLGENYIPFIQTDVAINPGNSGGPLFNLGGEVVGINAQIYTRSGGYMGVSFAIPSNLAKNVSEQLIQKGKVSRGWLGVLIQQLDQGLAESYGLDRAQGALVSRVLDGSPAQKAGFKNGDVILKFNGMDIYNSSELPPMVGSVLPGEKASVEVLREGKIKRLVVVIEELPSNDELASNRVQPTQPNMNEVLNIVVEPLTNEEMEALGEAGLKVTVVLEGPAKNAGVIPGDVITMIGSRAIKSTDDLNLALENTAKGKAFALRILRNGAPMFIPVRLK